ncbi:flagellar motor switch protein FliG [Treponema sp. R8-4-B8]
MEDQQVKPFDFINQIDIAHLLIFIWKEHPQTIALVLSFMEPAKSSIILQNMPNEIQSDVLRRIIMMNKVSAEVVGDVEQVLKEELSKLSSSYFNSGGLESAKMIINYIDSASEKHIIEALEDEDPELAEEIKKRLFVFEDIVKLDDRSVQKVMREVDSQELAKALKGVNSEVRDKFFRNMTKRAAAMLKEDMDYMGPIRLKDVEEAQKKIIYIIRYLEERDEIVIARAEDKLIVGECIKTEFEWENLISIGDDDISRIIAEADYPTLLKSLKLTSLEIIKKITKNMGFFKSLKLRRDIRRLKNVSVNDVKDAQNKIISIFLNLSDSENAETKADNMENDND